MGYAKAAIPHRAGRKQRTRARRNKRTNRGEAQDSRAISPEKAKACFRELKGKDDVEILIVGFVVVLIVVAFMVGLFALTSHI